MQGLGDPGAPGWRLKGGLFAPNCEAEQTWLCTPGHATKDGPLHVDISGLRLSSFIPLPSSLPPFLHCFFLWLHLQHLEVPA